MDKILKQLLESQVLTTDVKTALQEAWEAKLAESRQELEEQVRSEFSKRYEYDKAQLVEAMDTFLAENLQKELSEFHAERSEQQSKLDENIKLLHNFVLGKLKEELTEFNQDRQAVIEERLTLAERNEQQMQAMKKFVLEQLKDELNEFQADKKALSEERIQLHKSLRETRLAYKEEYVKRMNTLESFVMNQIKEELTEFQQDKRMLEEQRVKLATESKRQLEETKRAFITKAANLVEHTTMKALRSEMREMKEDLRIARENNFGRRMFEAYAAEYMTSYLAEGSKVRALEEKLMESKAELEKTRKMISEQKRLLESQSRKAKLAEEKAQRATVLNDLLNPLPRDRKEVMATLLEGVKTERLEETFKRYLPTVMKDSGIINKRSKLVESKTESKSITGDRSNRLSETIEQETTNDKAAEIIQLRKLAGLD